MHALRLLPVMACLAAAFGCSPANGPPGSEPPAPETAMQGTPDPLIDRDLLFGNPERTQGRLSPDGRSISYIAPLDGVLNVWVAPAGDIAAARAITRDTGRGIRNHFWAADGAHVLYLQDTGGDEDFLLHAINLETGEVRNLTPMENTTAQVIAISRDHPDTLLVGLNNRDPRFHDVHRLTLSSGELELIETNEGFLGYLADRNLDLRLALAPLPGGGMEVLRPAESGWESFLTVGQEDDMTTSPIAIAPDGEAVYMIDSRERDTAALVRVDLASGEREILGEDARADVSDVFVDAVSREVAAFATNYLKPEWTVLDQAFAADFARLDASLEGEWQVVSQSHDGQRWLLWSGQATRPGAYHLYDRQADTLRDVFVTQPALSDQPLTGMHPEVIRARDGLSLVSYLSLPRWMDPDGDGRPSAPVPMVLLVHGGPWARDTYGFDAQHQWLTNRGYAVLSVNFRGSTGFGKGFINAADGEWAGRMHDDLLDAVDWAVAEGITTSEQVAIMGGSYGGYATLVGLTFTPETFACGVDIVGPSNLETLLDSIPPYWAAFFENLATRVGDPRTEEGLALLRERSPLHRADQIRRPLLIAQGANDPRVKQAESDQIVAAMQANEQPVTYVLYPDEGHGFARPQNRLAFYAITEAFLAECLDGQAQAIGDALAGSSTQVPVGADFVSGLEAALSGFEATITR